MCPWTRTTMQAVFRIIRTPCHIKTHTLSSQMIIEFKLNLTRRDKTLHVGLWSCSYYLVHSFLNIYWRIVCVVLRLRMCLFLCVPLKYLHRCISLSAWMPPESMCVGAHLSPTSVQRVRRLWRQGDGKHAKNNNYDGSKRFSWMISPRHRTRNKEANVQREMRGRRRRGYNG